jgi:MscS family membrane protein
MKTLKTLIWLLVVAVPFVASAQSDNQQVPVTLENPYNTIYSHLHYLQEDSYQPELAAQTLNTQQDSARRVRLAVQLKQVLDGRGLYVPVSQLPRDSNYVDSTTQKHYYTPFPRDLPEVYLERVDEKWYYSEETVEAIPRLHKEVFPFGTDILLNILPQYGQDEFLGLKVWQYIGLLILLAAGVVVFWLLNAIISPLVRRLTRFKRFPSLIDIGIVRQITRIISVLIVVYLIRTFLPVLQLPIKTAEYTVLTIRIVNIILIVWLLFKILEVGMRYFERFTEKTDSKLDEQLLPILRRTLEAIIVVGGFIQALRVLDVNITALIAGISIGGLALALAAQDTLKNLFGSLTIFLDKPFQIGDWISFSGVDGTVEEVGVRSTRVRTFYNSLVYVPNGKLADMVVDNYGLRVYRRFSTKLTIAYGTPTPLISKFVEGLRQIVERHPNTRKDYYHIYLNELGSHSYDILFYVFFAVPSWAEELRARHEVLMAAIDLAHELGVQFAFPTQTLHVETFPEKAGNTPTYDTSPEAMDKRMNDFFEQFENKYKGNGAS